MCTLLRCKLRHNKRKQLLGKKSEKKNTTRDCSDLDIISETATHHVHVILRTGHLRTKILAFIFLQLQKIDNTIVMLPLSCRRPNSICAWIYWVHWRRITVQVLLNSCPALYCPLIWCWLHLETRHGPVWTFGLINIDILTTHAYLWRSKNQAWGQCKTYTYPKNYSDDQTPLIIHWISIIRASCCRGKNFVL